MRKFLVLLTVLLLAGGGWWWWRTHRPDGDAAPAEAEQFATAQRGDIVSSLTLTGEIEPGTQVEIKPEVGGKIRKLHVEPGQQVKRGDPLVEIDDTDLQKERESLLTDITGAQIALDKTRRNYERGRELHSTKLVSQEVFDNLRSDFEIAENALEKSRRRLEVIDERILKTHILSPSDGTVLSVPVIEGQVVVAAASVNSGSLLLTVADLSRLIIDTHINQVDVARLPAKAEAQFGVEAVPGVKLPAKIHFIAPLASVKNGVKGFKVEAEINRLDPRLRPGMTVVVEVPVGIAKDAVTLPVAAVFKEPDESMVVFVRTGRGHERRTVEVGLSDLFQVEIRSGLEVGEQVLLTRPESTENPGT